MSVESLAASLKHVTDENRKLKEENKKLQEVDREFDMILRDAVESVVLGCYSPKYKKSTVAKEFWKNVVMQKSFLEGEFIAIYKLQTNKINQATEK